MVRPPSPFRRPQPRMSPWKMGVEWHWGGCFLEDPWNQDSLGWVSQQRPALGDGSNGLLLTEDLISASCSEQPPHGGISWEGRRGGWGGPHWSRTSLAHLGVGSGRGPASNISQACPTLGPITCFMGLPAAKKEDQSLDQAGCPVLAPPPACMSIPTRLPDPRVPPPPSHTWADRISWRWILPASWKKVEVNEARF